MRGRRRPAGRPPDASEPRTTPPRRPARPRYAVRRSTIHGRGLVATAPIAAGQRIGRAEAAPTTRNGAYVLWLVDEDGGEEGFRICNELRFVNHADAPNAEFRDLDLYALHDIATGEEITLDYGDEWRAQRDGRGSRR